MSHEQQLTFSSIESPTEHMIPKCNSSHMQQTPIEFRTVSYQPVTTKVMAEKTQSTTRNAIEHFKITAQQSHTSKQFLMLSGLILLLIQISIDTPRKLKMSGLYVREICSGRQKRKH